MRLDLVIGPNGAGKSTFIRKVLVPSLPPATAFVNADEIARQRWPDDPEQHAYEAADIAARTRSALIRAGRPFIAETVFSHPSKLDLVDDARATAFTVALHVLMVPEDLAVARVDRRVASGGHWVPEDKIRQRHRRLWSIAVEAAERAESATFYDNTHIDRPRVAAQGFQGVMVGRVAWPTWTPDELSSRWPGTAT